MEGFGIIVLIILALAGFIGLIALIVWFIDELVPTIRRTENEVDALFEHFGLVCTNAHIDVIQTDTEKKEDSA